MEPEKLAEIFASRPGIEGVVHLSRDGLPLAWHCVKGAVVEEVTSIAAGLFATGVERGLLAAADDARLLIEADCGEMLVRQLADQSLLLVLSSRGTSLAGVEPQIEAILASISIWQE